MGDNISTTKTRKRRLVNKASISGKI
jgi:hypothetical protein